MITFGAGYIAPAKIDRLAKNKELIPNNAAFVEMKPESMRDNITLNIAASLLPKRKRFARAIWENFVMTYNGKLKDAKVKYFAITKEQSNYKFVKPNNVLGMAEVSFYPLVGNTVYVNYIQVFKNFIRNKFDHVGTSIIDNIKQLYPDKDIILNAIPSTVPFYEKNDFVKDENQPDERSVRMRYSPNKN